MGGDEKDGDIETDGTGDGTGDGTRDGASDNGGDFSKRSAESGTFDRWDVIPNVTPTATPVATRRTNPKIQKNWRVRHLRARSSPDRSSRSLSSPPSLEGGNAVAAVMSSGSRSGGKKWVCPENEGTDRSNSPLWFVSDAVSIVEGRAVSSEFGLGHGL